METSAALPEGVPQLLELFAARLESVAFPDVDLTRLQARSTHCEEQAAQVTELESRMAQLEAELAAARLDANEGRRELLAMSLKAVAYAKVYAADNEELVAELDALPLAGGAKKRKTSRTRGKGKGRAKASRTSTPQRALGLSEAREEASKSGLDSAPGVRSGTASLPGNDAADEVQSKGEAPGQAFSLSNETDAEHDVADVDAAEEPVAAE